MAEYTKGEWKIDAGPRSYSIGVDGKVICDMRLPKKYGVPIKEVEANARLIAAAPDLLAACEMANQIDAVDNGALYQEWKKELLLKLDAALTKAKPSQT